MHNLLFVLWIRKWIPLHFKGVLENTLVWLQFLSKLADVTLCLWFIMQLFRFLGLFILVSFHILCLNWALVALIHSVYLSAWGWHPPTPLRTAYRPILTLRTAYRHVSVSRTAYRLTTKTTMFGVSIYIKKIKWQSVACTCTINLSNVSFDVFAC